MPLDAASLAEASSRNRLLRHVHLLESTHSTNDAAATLGRAGAPAGTTLFALSQTAGRGRLGRRWDSPAGAGLWFSILLRPSLPLELWTRLTLWGAVGVSQTLESLAAIPTEIKWPNDILLDGRKVCGILTEAFHGTPGGPFAVAGFGLNLNQTSFPADLPNATSLRLATGKTWDPNSVATSLLQTLDSLYPLLELDFPALLDFARARDHLLHRPITLRAGSETLHGTGAGLDPHGALLVRLPDGSIHAARAGEATLAPAT